MSPKSTSSSAIRIKSGMTIGYPGSWLRREKEDFRLAGASDEIALHPGRHLLLARNGRGKTTLLKTLAGLIPVIEGEFEVAGQVQYIDEELRFDPELTSRQIFKAFFANGLLEKAFSFAERLELDVRKPYGKLSKGNRQKVTLILAETRALDNRPQVMLLDEPFSGLDFHVRDEVDRIWRENCENIVRLVCVHPDEPTLKAESAVLITDSSIRQERTNGEIDWLETRQSLN